MKFSKSTIAQAIGAVIAAGMASQSFAVDASQYNEATQVTLRISGSTATRPGLLNLFKLNNASNGICADGTLDLYISSDNAQYLALCTGRTGGSPALPAALQGTRIAMFKSDQGGSGNGVAPLVRSGTQVTFWNVPAGGGFLASCTGVTTNPATSSFSTYVLHTGCSVAGGTTSTRNPDAGISDLEPSIFKSAFAPALTNSEIAAIPGGSISAVIFGVPVTLNVRDNMQRIQFPTSSVCHPDNASYLANAETEACQPSLTKGQVAALVSQNYADWNSVIGLGGNTVAIPDGVPAHALGSAGETYICRRVSTSGTQATFETQLLGQRCVSGVPGFATQAGDLYAPAQHVFEGSGSGDVVTCLKARQAAGQGAVGVLSLEFPTTNTRDANDSGYRYIKLNGVSPCLLNIAESKYDFVGESTMQWRTATISGLPALTGSPLNLATAVRDRIGAPAVVNDLNGSFSHSFCSTLGSGALMGNALANAAGAPVPPFTVGGGGAGDVVLHPILTKTRGINGANSCGAMIDILPTQQVN